MARISVTALGELLSRFENLTQGGTYTLSVCEFYEGYPHGIGAWGWKKVREEERKSLYQFTYFRERWCVDLLDGNYTFVNYDIGVRVGTPHGNIEEDLAYFLNHAFKKRFEMTSVKTNYLWSTIYRFHQIIIIE